MDRAQPILGEQLLVTSRCHHRRRLALCIAKAFHFSPGTKNLDFYVTWDTFLKVSSLLKSKSSETSFYLAIFQIRISKSFHRILLLKV